MAFGKARNKQRSSGTSYTSTLTTMVFIALCVLGVWMLTSNSVIPPQATSRTTTDTGTSTTTTTNADYSSNKNSHPSESTNKKNSAVFEDNPGQLPEDAVKSDDPTQSKEINGKEKYQADQENVLAENSKNSANVGSSSETAKEAESNEQDGGDRSKKDEDNVLKKPGSVVEENPQGLPGKESVEEQEKQKQRETQVSEESSMTQNQEVEIRKTDQESKQGTSTQKNSEGEDSQQTRDDQESNQKQEVHKSKVVEETQRNSEVDHHGSLQDHMLNKDQQKTLVWTTRRH